MLSSEGGCFDGEREVLMMEGRARVGMMMDGYEAVPHPSLPKSLAGAELKTTLSPLSEGNRFAISRT